MQVNVYAYLYYFFIVAEEENISRAAKRLFVSQPALSTAMAKLEKEIGVALFDRRKNKIKLNEAGACLYQACRKAFATIDDGVAKARHIDAGNKKNVRIASSIRTVENIVAEAKQEFPEIESELTICDTEEIVNGVAEGKLDIGINFGHVDDSRVAEKVLMEGPYCIQVNSEHPLSRRRTVSMQELADYQLFCNRLSHTHEQIMSLFEAAHCSCKLLRLDESEVLFKAMLAGLGAIFCLPQPLAGQCSDRIIPVSGCQEPARVVLITGRREPHSDEIECICEFFEDKFQQSEEELNKMLEKIRKGE